MKEEGGRKGFCGQGDLFQRKCGSPRMRQGRGGGGGSMLIIVVTVIGVNNPRISCFLSCFEGRKGETPRECPDSGRERVQKR
jgi:hypothetical protein